MLGYFRHDLPVLKIDHDGVEQFRHFLRLELYIDYRSNDLVDGTFMIHLYFSPYSLILHKIIVVILDLFQRFGASYNF